MSCYLQVGHTEISKNVTTTLLKVIFVFHCSVHLCWHSSSTYQQEHAFTSSKSCSLSSAVTDARHSAVPCHLNNVYLKVFSPKEWTSDNLIQCMVWTVHYSRQHCQSNMWDGLCGVHTCMWPSNVMEEQHCRHISCWMNMTKSSIQAHLMLKHIGYDFTAVPRGKMFTRRTFSLSEKSVTMILPADCTL